MTLEIKRKDSGKVETVELIGVVTQEQEDSDGSHSLDSSAERGD